MRAYNDIASFRTRERTKLPDSVERLRWRNMCKCGKELYLDTDGNGHVLEFDRESMQRHKCQYTNKAAE